MAEDKQATPEQQLLKLIEERNKSTQAASSAAPSQAPRKKPFFPSFANFSKIPGSVMGVLSFWKRKSKRRVFSKRASFGIAEINRVLLLTMMVLFVYVVFDAVASARNLQRPPNFTPPKDLSSKVRKDMIRPLEETAYYVQKISSRDIFKEGKKEEAPVETVQAPALTQGTADAIQNLALVGISWSSNPDAIVEDKAQQRTYFVKRGQMVGESVKVEAIFKDHVIVTYEDREYELR